MEQQHSEAQQSVVLKSQYDPERHASATELIESLSVNQQDDGEESSEGRSSVAAARSTLEERPEAVRVAEQTRKTGAELSLRVANAEARISAMEQKVSERESRRQKLLRKRLTSKCSSWRSRMQLRTRLSPTRTPTVQPFRRSRRQKCPGLDSDCSSARHGPEQANPWHSDGA